ncbi:MAG TPA: nuclear transport factor 2 family protein [Anaerolineales bacterium]
MPLKGKGFFIWQIRNTEGGNASAIASLADQANLSHVLIKIADGTYSYNVNSSGVDLVPPVAQALRARGIQVWGWHYVYGDSPIDEANKAIQRIQQTNMQGYVIDAEGEYKQPGKDKAAAQFMSRLRSALPNFPIALCSYRYPSYHPQLPWKEFLEKCTYNMPQVYWVSAHNPGDQLRRSVSEFQAMTPFRPIIPVGSAYKSGSWAATASDVTEFLRTAQSLNLSAANFWEWANCRTYLPSVWNAIRDYKWDAEPPPPPPTDITEQYITALNTHNPAQVVGLYTPAAVHVTAARTIQGTVAIQNWYQTLFTQLLPNASFTLVSFSGSGSSRHFTWTATSSAGKVNNGSDTLGLIEGKIAYHFSSFSIT